MIRRSVAVGAVVILAVLVSAGAAVAHKLPVVYNGLVGYAHVSPTASPPGANDWGCKATRAHPRPVVLVHGTFEDMSANWRALSPLLFDHGYCVFALNYGSYRGSNRLGIDGIGPIATSARQLSEFVNRVLAAAHARQVDLVGHSQGGMMPRYYIRFLGGAAKVHTLVGLAPGNHGTTLNGFAKLVKAVPGAEALVGSLCPACRELGRGSSFLRGLNAGAETVASVHYTVIESRYDELVTPYSSAFLSGPNVTNITLQSQCRLDLGEHLSMPYDHIADADVLSALDPAHPLKPRCTPVLPVVGG